MILTTIRDCKDRMSIDGWLLFVKHQAEHNCVNVLKTHRHTEVCLSKQEVVAYGYQAHGAWEHKARNLTPAIDAENGIRFVEVTSDPDLFERSIKLNGSALVNVDGFNKLVKPYNSGYAYIL